MSGWLDDRTGLGTWWSGLRQPAPWSAGFAAATAALLLNQAVTGALLAAYYTPTLEGAWSSTRLILHEVPLGWLVRSLHLWGQHLVVATLLAWIGVAVAKGAYVRPREVAWMALVALFFAVTLAGQTGQVLPMDEHGLSGALVAASLAGPAESLVLGGRGVADPTVGRFFAAHVFLLPALWGVFFVVRGRFAARHPEPGGATRLERAGLSALGTVALLATLAVAIPLGLGPEGSALAASGTAKPHWYLLPMYQALKWVDVWTANLAALAAAAFLFLVPFLPRPVSVAGSLLLFLGAAALGVMGALA